MFNVVSGHLIYLHFIHKIPSILRALDLDWVMVDSRTVRAHEHAAGRKEGIFARGSAQGCSRMGLAERGTSPYQLTALIWSESACTPRILPVVHERGPETGCPQTFAVVTRRKRPHHRLRPGSVAGPRPSIHVLHKPSRRVVVACEPLPVCFDLILFKNEGKCGAA